MYVKFNPQIGQTPVLPGVTACPSTNNLYAWAKLISFRGPHSIQTRLSLLKWPIQPIENAVGPISLDYYPVEVRVLPIISGRRVTARELLSHIRLNINSFVDRTLAKFQPYDGQEKVLWLSPKPLGAGIHIEMANILGPINVDGSVVLSEFTQTHWIFSPIFTPADRLHPVSGNREFGFTGTNSGTYIFYTRGADRPTRPRFNNSRTFKASHQLWSGYQNKIAAFINTNKGEANIRPMIACHYDWDTVRRMYHKPPTTWIIRAPQAW